jgi:hypothetical protein
LTRPAGGNRGDPDPLKPAPLPKEALDGRRALEDQVRRHLRRRPAARRAGHGLGPAGGRRWRRRRSRARRAGRAVDLDAGGQAGLRHRQVHRQLGTPTFSATPLAWSHAQFVRLALSIQAGHPVEQPALVACRYLHACSG